MPSLRIQLSALAAAVLGAAAVQAAPSHGGVAAVSSASQTGSGEGDVKIGIMDTISTAVDTASLREGLVLLSNPLEKDFRISWRDIVTPDAAQEVLHQKPDFLMLPTEQIDLMEEQGVQTFRIATRKPWTATDAAHAVGSLVVTRADRTDINTLEDLAGRHIAADTPTSLTGWLALQGEIARAGHDPEKFFGRTTFLSFAYPGVLSAVLHGSADAAVLPTCLLELLVLNLVKNAAEAVHEQTDEHGRATGRVIVTLAAIRTETPPEGCGRRQWMLTVADNGRKLTEAEKACLMHSLESVKPDGLGLGLSIVRGIADSHGAKIEFVAKPAGGVVVSVLFDELDEEAAARAAGAIDAGRN